MNYWTKCSECEGAVASRKVVVCRWCQLYPKKKFQDAIVHNGGWDNVGWTVQWDKATAGQNLPPKPFFYYAGPAPLNNDFNEYRVEGVKIFRDPAFIINNV